MWGREKGVFGLAKAEVSLTETLCSHSAWHYLTKQLGKKMVNLTWPDSSTPSALGVWNVIWITQGWCKPFIIRASIFASESGLGCRRMQLPSPRHVLLYLQLTSQLVLWGLGLKLLPSSSFQLRWLLVGLHFHNSFFFPAWSQLTSIRMNPLAMLRGKLGPVYLLSPPH